MTVYGRLSLKSADGTEEVFRLTKPEMTLGREADNDIVLADQKVSRLHARLECSDRACILIDNDSANGTYVDGQRVERVTLRAGSLIKLGNSTLRFEQDVVSRSAKPRARRVKHNAPAKVETDRQLLHQFLDELIDESGDEPKHGTSETGSSIQTDAVRNKILRIPHLVIYTPQKTWRLRLNEQESWIIGRMPDSDIFIDHQKVSRQHARIERRGDEFIIRDLNSTNGTYLGQQRIQDHTLRHTDTLMIGHAQLVFKDVKQVDQGLTGLTPKTERVPVIVVPGVYGSTLWRGPEKIWPSLRTILTEPEKFEYLPDNPVEARGILGEFVVVPKIVEIASYSRMSHYLEESLDYTLGKDLLEFAYDWRDDIRLVAQKLAEAVDNWDTDRPLTIIAHSMGCLVSRYYVDCLGGRRKVRKLILIGGPNYGSPSSLLNVLPDRLKQLQPFMVSIGGSLAEKLMRVFASFPASYQLLPTYPAIFDQHGEPLYLYEDQSWLPEEKQSLLQAAHEFRRDLKNQAVIPTTCIFGYGANTITRLNIERDQQGTWQTLEMMNTEDGDGVVPAESAILAGAEIHPVHQGHNQLYVDEDVLMRMKYELIV